MNEVKMMTVMITDHQPWIYCDADEADDRTGGEADGFVR